MRPRPTTRLLIFAIGIFALTKLLAPVRTSEVNPNERERGEDGAKPLIGGSREEVARRYGAPGRVSRQVYQLRCLEQWHYGAPHHLRITFDWQRGQKPVVIRTHSLAVP